MNLSESVSHFRENGEDLYSSGAEKCTPHAAVGAKLLRFYLLNACGNPRKPGPPSSVVHFVGRWALQRCLQALQNKHIICRFNRDKVYVDFKQRIPWTRYTLISNNVYSGPFGASAIPECNRIDLRTYSVSDVQYLSDPNVNYDGCAPLVGCGAFVIPVP